MNLPFFKKFNKKVLPLYYLVLVLRDEKTQAVIFEELEGKVKIIGQKEEHLSVSIDEVTQEELLEKLDRAISSAESSLPENIQTQKTIFGVKESWTDNDQIKKEHLAKLKKVSEELDLIPIGFLVISQAISHLLQKEEGAPVSAILVEVNKKRLTVTLLRAGKGIETKTSEIHDSIPFTVDTLLKHFNVPEILPSRIIIFNGKEDLSQEFISHTWSKSLPFLHLPQITSLPEDFDAKSVLFGAATQMGFEVSQETLPEEPRPEHALSEKDFESPEEDKKPFEETKTYENLGVHDFGFAKDVDVAKMPAPQSSREMEEIKETIENQESIPQINSEEISEIKTPKQLGNISSIIKNSLTVILGFIFAIAQKLNIKKFSSLIPKGGLRLIAPVLILIIALIGSYFLFLKSRIEITVDPKILEQDKSVLFSTIQDTDPNSSIIKGEFISSSQDGSTSAPATGKKDVGTPAKGSVTIFNLSSDTKKLPAGTVITSPNDLDFILDSSVTLASASSSTDSNFNVTTKPSTVNVNVTADQLGKESNLPSGTKFSVGSSDTKDIVAKNDNPFSGGTKKTVTVVSKNDSSKLEENLIKQLEDSAKEDLQKQISGSRALLPSIITKALGKKSLNAKVGDETSQVTLSGTVEYQGLSYDKNDFIEFSKSFLSEDVQSNQEIDYGNIKTSVIDIKQKNDDEVEAKLNIKALLLPKISQNNLTKDIKGKSFDKVEELIRKLPQVTSVTIKLAPNLPFLPKNLPIKESNIKISIKING